MSLNFEISNENWNVFEDISFFNSYSTILRLFQEDCTFSIVVCKVNNKKQELIIFSEMIINSLNLQCFETTSKES